MNTQGFTVAASAFYNGAGLNYFGGSVGIGTYKTSGNKLTVDGTIAARRVKVTQETWADYVFDNEYKLPGLQEVQHYITENKHLPEVPSAAEVEEKGIDVGEMNKILLKKVEELTLYLLKEHETVELLKQQVAELSKGKK